MRWYGVFRVLKQCSAGHLLGWRLATLVIALAIASPIAVVASNVFLSSGGVWAHLWATVLTGYITGTLLLVVGVAIGTALTGVTLAWLIVMCRFPGRGWLEWAVLLPLAVPAYVLAYALTDLFQYAGPVQVALRAWTGWSRQDYWFPAVRSPAGAVLVLTMVLYPYVYLLARAAFLEQSTCILDISRTLGRGAWSTFARIAMPLARPAVVSGIALVAMETMADFGTVQYFAVDTLTTGINRVWFALGSPVAAAQIASLLMLLVFAAIALEKLARGRRPFHRATTVYRPLPRYQLKGLAAAAAMIITTLPLLLGFVIPVVAMARLLLLHSGSWPGLETFPRLAFNSLALAVVAALITVVLALCLCYGRRLAPSLALNVASTTAQLGYAIPGAVIAIGVLIPANAIDRLIDNFSRASFGVSTGLLLTGTAVALVFAYVVRFLALATHPLEAGLARIPLSLHHAARVLAPSPAQALLRVHLPVMLPSQLTAVLLVFVEILKELPATLIVRPFNLDTLAVRVYQLAADERLAEAAIPALSLVAVGLVPVWLLSRTIAGARPGTTQARRLASADGAGA